MAEDPTAPSRTPSATLHLFTVSGIGVARALWRMGADRPALGRQPGLRFAKLLGTGDGRTFDVRDADLTTWGLLTVWDDTSSRDHFIEHSPTMSAWRSLSDEQWRADLLPVLAKGRWSGRTPFAPPAGRSAGATGPVAAITRARLHLGGALRFYRAVPPVTADLHRADGLLLSLGIGEAPVGLQGTFSVWRDAEALTGFAYATAAHRDVIAATDRVGWYAEDLFARFAVTGSSGTLKGADPLAHRHLPAGPH